MADEQETNGKAEENNQDAVAFLESGQRSYAKENYAEAAEAYSHAVEILTTKHGELSIESVDALIAYGKALLRHAIASSGVLGGSAPAPTNSNPAETSGQASSSKVPLPATLPAAEDAPTALQRANFHFGGDAPDDDEEDAGEEENAENEEADQSGAGNSPEDDLETAFGVLDMARTVLTKVESPDETVKLKMAGVHDLLGEVATESEKFTDAAQEYKASLDILSALLPKHDRRLASAHLMAALSYEFIPQSSAEITSQAGREAQQKAVDHAEKAREVLSLRKAFLLEEEKQAGRTEPSQYDKKVQSELEDIDGISGELDEKIEELKAMPEVAEQTERDKKADEFLQGAALPANAPVNDLGSMGLVKKRKPTAAATSNGNGSSSTAVDTEASDPKGKRKAVDDEAPLPKKVKFAEAAE